MEKITFGDGIPGYVVGPKGAPGLLVVQEWWGVTDIVKEQAQLLSVKDGYRCLIPDLYKGEIGVDAEEASHVRPSLLFLLRIFALRPILFSLRLIKLNKFVVFVRYFAAYGQARLHERSGGDEIGDTVSEGGRFPNGDTSTV